VQVTRSARKHGIGREEIRGVLAAPLRTVEQGAAVLHIGLTPRRDLIEVVVAPGDPVTVLHAMRLRPANYHHLTGPGLSAP
jgi:nitrogenase subunit NifH